MTTTATAPAKKITLATVKSFVRKNRPALLIKVRAKFDGMVDGLEWDRAADFSPALDTDRHAEHTLGIQGAWFVLGGGDRFQPFESDTLVGYEIANCCGYFTLAVAK
jgi:hypothetical protein